jgi:hypothetical protein
MGKLERRERKRERKNGTEIITHCVYDESHKDVNFHLKKIFPQLLMFFSKDRSMDIAECLYYARARLIKGNLNLINTDVAVNTLDGFLVIEKNLKIEIKKSDS